MYTNTLLIAMGIYSATPLNPGAQLEVNAFMILAV